MTTNLNVGLGELIVSDDPEAVLVAFGLGSCLGIIAYDAETHKGGLLHAVLPSANAGSPAAQTTPTKFVDTGLEELLASFPGATGTRRPIIKVVGGALMFQTFDSNSTLNIGDRNLAAMRAFLRERNIPIVASRVGGDYGRTARLYVADGRTTVRSMGQPEEDF